MRIGSLFSGIGGLELGLERAGLGPVIWQCEIDPFARQVLAKHWPNTRRFEDVRSVDENAPAVDLICGGFPCQDLSYAGNGAGLEGARSGLWFEYLRVVRALRPRCVVVENVPALLTRGLGVVLGGLAESGYDAQWDCLPAAAVGAPHRRDRLFVVAWRVSDTERHALRFEPERGPGAARPANARNTESDDVGGETLADITSERGHDNGPSHGQQPSTQYGPARGGGRFDDVADADGERRSREGNHGAGGTWTIGRESSGDREALADADRARRRSPGQGAGGPGERSPRGDNAHGRDVSYAWPPGPGDMHAWGRLPVEAQPAICRGANGVPRGMDRRRLKALGNAVVPQVAEVIGRAIVEAAA